MGSLSFFRIKPEITKPDDIIRDRDSANLRAEPVKISGTRIGELYLKRIERSKPSWLNYFGDSVDLEGVKLKTASLAALFLVKQDDAFYAIVFGYGASLLAEGVVDERFGLRATLNAVDPSHLRSIDHKRLEAISRHTREQLSRAGDLGQFGLDINRDLLRAVTGAPTDGTYGTRLSGSDQLTVTADIPLPLLQDALSTFHELSEQKTYAKNFPWVDNIQDIRDKALITELDKQLAKELASGSDTIWLAPPEIIDWSKTAGFRYKSGKKAEAYADINLEDYDKELGSLKDIDGPRLQHDRIYHIRSDTDTGTHSWSVLRCLVGEIVYKQERYVLSEGTWYRINDDFLGTLNDFVAGIKTAKLDLPDYDDASEEKYNERAWKANKSQLALLDQSFIQYPQRGKVEVCDLYSKEKQLIHVKRLNGSSTLSHLFNQGTVSAELLRDEVGFRTQFLKKIPGFEWGTPADPIPRNTFEVCYAIVCRPNKPLDLPFFSKLTLRTAAQNLDRLGFKVSTYAIASK